jgi:hypothetical protein
MILYDAQLITLSGKLANKSKVANVCFVPKTYSNFNSAGFTDLEIL